MNFEINSYLLILLIIFVLVNIVAFLIMLVDKSKAQISGAERISEGMLFFLAAAFGSLGVYLGMFAFRHKTQKWYFRIGIPLIFFENCAFLYALFLLSR